MSTSFDPDRLYPRSTELDDGRRLHIYQSEIGDVGCVVWDAAIVLAKFYEHILSTPTGPKEFDADEEQGDAMQALSRLAQIIKQDLTDGSGDRMEVVELGAGTGYAGIVAASFGARVKVTDLPEFVDLMNYNVKQNLSAITERGGECSVHPLVWGEEVNSKAKLVILADCIYYEKSLSPLVKTLVDLCGPDSLVVCCHEERTTDNKPELQRKFFAEVREYFSIVKIPTAMQHPMYSSDDIHVHILQPLTLTS